MASLSPLIPPAAPRNGRSDGDRRSADRHGRVLVAVRAYERRDPDGSGIQHVQAHQRGAPDGKREWERAWERHPNREWRERIVGTESEIKDNDHGYRSRPKDGSSARGRYQINEQTLRGAGWKDKTTGEWTERAKFFGVTSEEEFLVNENAQEEALNDVLREYERQLVSRGAMQSAGQTIKALNGTEIPVTVSGLIAASHREGTRKVREYLDHRAQGLPTPMSIPNVRSDLSKFNEIERRLRDFATIPYRRLTQ